MRQIPSAEPIYYFVNADTGLIHLIERSQLSFGGGVEPKSVQKMIDIPRQENSTCAAHALNNCLKLLDDISELSTEQKAVVDTRTEGNKRFFKKLVSSLSGVGVLTRLLIGRTQSATTIRILECLNFKVERTRDIAQIKQLLKEGIPAILGLKAEATELTQAYRNSDFEFEIRAGDYGDGFAGSHAILVYGWIDGLGAIAYDSGSASFYMLSEERIASGLTDTLKTNDGLFVWPKGN